MEVEGGPIPYPPPPQGMDVEARLWISCGSFYPLLPSISICSHYSFNPDSPFPTALRGKYKVLARLISLTMLEFFNPGWTFNMNDEIEFDNEWVNAFESDPYDGVPSDLPQEVVETFTDYISDSSAPMGINSWEEEFDYRRFDNLIYRPQTNQELCMMQEAACALRAFAQEFDADRSHYLLKYEQEKYEVEEQRCKVSSLDDENQDLTDQVCSLATSNVQTSLQRDHLVGANINLRKVSRRSYLYGLVFGLGFMVLFVAFIIGHLLP